MLDILEVGYFVVDFIYGLYMSKLAAGRVRVNNISTWTRGCYFEELIIWT